MSLPALRLPDDFLHYRELLRHGHPGLSFEPTSPGHWGLRPSPRILFGPVPREFPTWFYGDRGNEECGLLRIETAVLAGAIVLFSHGLGFHVPQNGIHGGSVPPEATALANGPPLRMRHLPGEFVLLPGPAYSMYGHWLVDFLPRIINLRLTGPDLTKLRYLLPSDLPRFAREWLSMTGITDGQIEYYESGRELCVVERALVPTGLRGAGRIDPLFARAAAFLRTCAIGDEVPQKTNRRVFVSRENWGNATRRLRNADELAGIAAQAGLEAVFPEAMPIREQVRLFRSAELIVGDYGSALHNAMFSGRGAIVIALRGTEGHPGFLQSGLCEALDQDMGYVFGETAPTPEGHAYTVQGDDLRRCLDLVLNLRR